MNLGDVNDDIEKLEMSVKELNDQKKQAPELASHMLVVMVREGRTKNFLSV